MKYVVDRVEEGYVIIENDNAYIKLKAEDFDFEVSEGDVLLMVDGVFVKDDRATESEKNRILDLQSRILKKNKNF